MFFFNMDLYPEVWRQRGLGEPPVLERRRDKTKHTFITQQASPVPLAIALPGTVAGPVDASGVDRAFVAELPLPAVAAPVRWSTRQNITRSSNWDCFRHSCSLWQQTTLACNCADQDKTNVLLYCCLCRSNTTLVTFIWIFLKSLQVLLRTL